MTHALSRRSGWFLFLLAFVVVYREVFETILFYALGQGNGLAMLGVRLRLRRCSRCWLGSCSASAPACRHPVLFVERYSHRGPCHRARWKGNSRAPGGRNPGSRPLAGVPRIQMLGLSLQPRQYWPNWSPWQFWLWTSGSIAKARCGRPDDIASSDWPHDQRLTVRRFAALETASVGLVSRSRPGQAEIASVVGTAQAEHHGGCDTRITSLHDDSRLNL